jgi:hypothetical protein
MRNVKPGERLMSREDRRHWKRMLPNLKSMGIFHKGKNIIVVITLPKEKW